MSKKIFIVFCFVILGCTLAQAATLTVTNCADSGVGSLRWAVETANATPGADSIYFNIPTTEAGFTTDGGYSWWKIQPGGFIDITDESTVIDGRTQPTVEGFTWPPGPLIEINGALAGNSSCFRYYENADDLEVYNLCINGFPVVLSWAIEAIGQADNIVVKGCYIGTNILGNAAIANASGLEIRGDNSIVGGTTEAERNILSGNTVSYGVLVMGNSCEVIGNYIGLDRTGTTAIPNNSGVSVQNCFDTIVGGTDPAKRNIISANTNTGLAFVSDITFRNYVYNNYIGTDVTGTLDRGNLYGVYLSNDAHHNIIGGTAAGQRNIISGNTVGVLITSNAMSNEVKGNYIGTAPDGSTGLGNELGVGINAAHNNRIEANLICASTNALPAYGQGIGLQNSSSNEIVANYIGTNSLGADLGNATQGIATAALCTFEVIGPGNIIAHNDSAGVFVTSEAQYILITQNTTESNAGQGILISSGGNNNIAYPDITTAEYESVSGQTTIVGTAPAAAVVEIFKVEATPDPTGRGEGAVYLGSVEANGSGDWVATVEGVTSSDKVTATASIYSSPGYTSEFSGNASIASVTTTTTTTTTTGTSTTTTSLTTTTRDNEPPEISAKIAGAGIKSGDYVGRASKFNIKITDNTSIDSVTLLMDGSAVTYLVYSDTGPEMDVVYMPSPDLTEGSHDLMIQASDVLGNIGTKEINDLQVSYAAARVVNNSVVCYPSSFAPEKGETINIAYNLTADADISVYVAGPAGGTHWLSKFTAGAMGGKAGYNQIEYNGTSSAGNGKLGNGIYVILVVSGSRSIGRGHLVVYE